MIKDKHLKAVVKPVTDKARTYLERKGWRSLSMTKYPRSVKFGVLESSYGAANDVDLTDCDGVYFWMDQSIIIAEVIRDDIYEVANTLAHEVAHHLLLCKNKKVEERRARLIGDVMEDWVAELIRYELRK